MARQLIQQNVRCSNFTPLHCHQKCENDKRKPRTKGNIALATYLKQGFFLSLTVTCLDKFNNCQLLQHGTKEVT